MKKKFLLFFAAVACCLGFVCCGGDDDDEVLTPVVYAGTVSYVGTEEATSELVSEPIIQLFKEKLGTLATVNLTESSFTITTTADQQTTITNAIQNIQSELQLLIEEKIAPYVSTCHVQVVTGTEVILNMKYINPDNSEGGHDLTEGTISGFTWQ